MTSEAKAMKQWTCGDYVYIAEQVEVKDGDGNKVAVCQANHAKKIVTAVNSFDKMRRLAKRVVQIFQPMHDKGQNGQTFDLLLEQAKAALAKGGAV